MLNKSWKARRTVPRDARTLYLLHRLLEPSSPRLRRVHGRSIVWTLDTLLLRQSNSALLGHVIGTKVIYNGGAQHVFCNALSRFLASLRTIFRETKSATNRIRSAAEICNWQPRFSDPGLMPNQSARYFAPACNDAPCGQTKGCAVPAKVVKTSLSEKTPELRGRFRGEHGRVAAYRETHSDALACTRVFGPVPRLAPAHRRSEAPTERPQLARSFRKKKSHLAGTQEREFSPLWEKDPRSTRPRRGSDPRARPVISDLPGGRLFANVSRGTSH